MLHILSCSTWKITNLNYTILPRQTFLTNTIYSGVATNYCSICRILTLIDCSFTILFASFVALIKLKSIVINFVFFFTPILNYLCFFGGAISVVLSPHLSFIAVPQLMLVLLLSYFLCHLRLCQLKIWQFSSDSDVKLCDCNWTRTLNHLVP